MTSAGSAVRPAADAAAYRAVEHIYHSYLTGLILMLASRAGAPRAAEVVFRTFRRQQLARFLPGLKKLGLDQLPHAVACAQYHYLSNQVGGVKVEYVYESDTKAWVRYPPPRWIWSGTAICGIPSEVSRAMLRGWHANNGVVLGNPRLGFVCTGSDRRRPAGARRLLQGVGSRSRARGAAAVFARRALSAVPGRSRAAPAREHMAGGTAAEGASQLCDGVRHLDRAGDDQACSARKRAAISPALRRGWSGCTPSTRSLALLGGVEAGAAGFAKAFARLARGQDDDAELQLEGSGATVRQTSWRLMAEREALSPAVFDAWNELWVGAALAHDRFMRVEVTERRDRGDPCWRWKFG